MEKKNNIEPKAKLNEKPKSDETKYVLFNEWSLIERTWNAFRVLVGFLSQPFIIIIIYHWMWVLNTLYGNINWLHWKRNDRQVPLSINFFHAFAIFEMRQVEGNENIILMDAKRFQWITNMQLIPEYADCRGKYA